MGDTHRRRPRSSRVRHTHTQTHNLVLPGTSGDTGGSAVQCAKGVRGLDVLVVYPRGRVTSIQEKHMITCSAENVHVFAGKRECDASFALEEVLSL